MKRLDTPEVAVLTRTTRVASGAATSCSHATAAAAATALSVDNLGALHSRASYSPNLSSSPSVAKVK